jgi:ribosomal protein L11 methyltransferase
LAAHVEPGGGLVAGGIIADRAPAVVEALERTGLSVVERRTDGDWVALRLEAPN